MNLLTETLPTKIKVNNNIYEINYDYRTAINILQACEDKELTHNEKVFIMVYNLYKNKIPDEDYIEAAKKASVFLDCNSFKKDSNDNKSRIFSFSKDGNYIFTGINSSHHIDLSEKPDLHWWKFMALFLDMDTECFFSELVYYRKRKLEGKLTKEEKKKYKEIKDLIEIDEDDIKRTEQQSQARKEFLKEFYDEE